MKLSQYAKQVGVSYETAWHWFKAGHIRGYQMPTGTIIVTEPVGSTPSLASEQVVIYARVSAAENKGNLDSQAQRLQDYCTAKGWQVGRVVKEVGSALNDERPKLLKLLTDPAVTVIVVEHKDRLTRFAFHYLEALLGMQARRIEVVKESEAGRDDLIQDLVSIITSFCARLYGQRRSKDKTERIIAELQDAQEGYHAS
jgi:predicted site-specific integrase-resolvase